MLPRTTRLGINLSKIQKMYISRIRIQNFRCFRDTTVEFGPGLNVIIGENNSGKTTLLKALALVFDRRGTRRPTIHDFCQSIDSFESPPSITVSVTLSSSGNDTPDDRATVATWLTTLDATWEAQLTYRFFLPEPDAAAFVEKVKGNASPEDAFAVLDEFLPKYVARVYGGNPDTMLPADSETLARFDCQTLDALRDVEGELFSGRLPLLRRMLQQVLDVGVEPDEKWQRSTKFRQSAGVLRDQLIDRLDTDRLFQLVSDTGAADGGIPELQGGVAEGEIIAALRLFVKRHGISVPATNQGLGYNNLLYISLVLASMAFRASRDRFGQNAAVFPMLLVEEPEAHLHPALQFKLLSHIVDRVAEDEHADRQVFVTTHSTHVTAAAGLERIVCLSTRYRPGTTVSYPARAFDGTAHGRESRGYVERYLDATKSAMLFAKAVLLVEGIAEQLVVPEFARQLGKSFDEHHVAIVRVDGVTFRRFLPLFGVGTACSGDDVALQRRVACLVDADPARKEKGKAKARWKSCFPFLLDVDAEKYEYRAASGVLTNLREMVDGNDRVKVYSGCMTFEYDMAMENYGNETFVTDVVPEKEALLELSSGEWVGDGPLKRMFDEEELSALEQLKDENLRQRHAFAAAYLRCIEETKGDVAFSLQQCMRSHPQDADPVRCPTYIREAIEWVTAGASAGEEG